MTATVKPASSKPAELFEFKSAALNLLAFTPKSSDLSALSAQLKQKLGASQSFFSDDPVVLDLTQLTEPLTALEVQSLAGLLKEYRLAPLGFRATGSVQIEAGRAAGLIPLPAEVASPRSSTSTPAAPQAASAPAPVIEKRKTLIVDQPVRSGQQVYARDADLIVMALVSQGAEVIADGNIHVYAPLRGRALAGARGDTSARILTLSMEAELVSIAGIYRSIDEPLPVSLNAKAAQVQLDGEKISISAIAAK